MPRGAKKARIVLCSELEERKRKERKISGGTDCVGCLM